MENKEWTKYNNSEGAKNTKRMEIIEKIWDNDRWL